MAEASRKYEDRVIAFIDILGFRAMINDTYKDDNINQESLDKLVSVLELIKGVFKEAGENSELPFSFKINFFSDSIVFSLRSDYNAGLIGIFETFKKIQIRLIEYEILLRGGVVVGKLIHEENLILGPAMNEAYDLESKSALYPRITIDPDVMEMSANNSEYEDNIFKIKEFDYHNTFELDFDNTYYINYFSDVKNYLTDGNEVAYYRKLRQLIRKGLQRKDIGIRMKYMWMLKKFNSQKPEYIKEMAFREIDEVNEQIGKTFSLPKLPKSY